MQDVLCLILGGGRGSRLYPLTKGRSEPAVPVAGKYRLIDIPLSNCLNSSLSRIYVLTQFLSVSLHRHLANSYKFDPFGNGFVSILAAQQTNETARWYRGTADAVRQNLRYIQDDGCREILLLYSDQLYRMDFRDLLRTHRDSGADVTLAVHPVPRDRASRLGIVRLDDHNRLLELVEKPQTADQLDRLQTSQAWLKQHGLAGQGRDFLANMGIYLFRRNILLDLLNGQPLANDFVLEFFPRALRSYHFQGYVHPGYWEDLGSIRSYFEANLALTAAAPAFDFNTAEGDIYTRMRYLPASRIGAAQLSQCLVSDGCIIEQGARLERCLVGIRSRIGRHVQLKEALVLGADRSETDEQRAQNRQQGIPNLGVGADCLIERAILDKDCRIGPGVQIVNRQQLEHADGANYHIRDGIVVIPDGAIVPEGTVI
jgi:glucose-1-phosphate adenylyltransferase